MGSLDSQEDESRKRFPALLFFWVLTAGMMLGWLLIYFFPLRDQRIRSLIPPCPFHYFTDLYCPGCGSSRALCCLARFDIAGAWSYNKMLVLFIPYLAWSYLEFASECLKFRFPRLTMRSVHIKILLWAIVFYWILRNIPFAPFDMLAPPEPSANRNGLPRTPAAYPIRLIAGGTPTIVTTSKYQPNEKLSSEPGGCEEMAGDGE